MTKDMNESLSEELNEPDLPKAIRRLRGKKAKVPTTDDPRTELRRLVLEHRKYTQTAVSIEHQASDHKNKETGEIIPSVFDGVVRAQMDVTVETLRKKASSLASDMGRALKSVPVYNVFLHGVFGLGPIISAYLVAEIDIHVATKPSSLRRFCGMAVIDGRLERRKKGEKSKFSSTMRERLFNMFQAMWKNQAKKSKKFPNGCTSKYLTVWKNCKHRKLSMPGVETVTVGGLIRHQRRDDKTGKMIPMDGVAHSYGWHKAADVFLEDLYIIWRTLEKLPVWASYYEDKLGFAHGGKISDKAPKNLTIEEALALVGDVGAQAV